MNTQNNIVRICHNCGRSEAETQILILCNYCYETYCGRTCCAGWWCWKCIEVGCQNCCKYKYTFCKDCQNI